MKPGRPSITASFVAYARATAAVSPMTTPPLRDPLAGALVPFPFSLFVPRGPIGQRAARVASLGLVDHIALRTCAIDDAIGAGSTASGPRQLVILGAGLDGRAYRMESLAGARVFEVDHPATHAAKTARAQSLSAHSKSIAHVAVDFGADDLSVALAGHGHDAALPTAWILEGVTMYLPGPITRLLFAKVATASASGSVFAVTYLEPLPHPMLHKAANGMFTLLGEPLGNSFRSDEIAEALAGVNMTIRSDTGPYDWARRFGASAALATLFGNERLAVAVKV